VAPQLASHAPRTRAIQLDAQVEPRAQDDLRRKGAPGLALELDLDQLPRPGPERA